MSDRNKVLCDKCGQKVALDHLDRFVEHWPEGEGVRCEASGLYPIRDYPSGSVWEISGGQWESDRRKH